jgi:BACON domain-containing protein
MRLHPVVCVAGIAVAAVRVSFPAQTLAVAPPLVVFSGVAGQSNPPAQSVSVTSTGATASSWRVTGVQRSWLTVTPRSGSAPASIKFSANISRMCAGTYGDTVRLTPNPATDTLLIPVVLVCQSGPAIAGFATYEIELSYTGYTGLAESPNCVVNPRGYDRLLGTVTGVETTESDEDIVYTGTLRRDTAIDFCETKGKRSPADDERVWCTATLVGYAVTQVELTVHSDEGTGGYLKATPAGGPMMRAVSGRCDPAEQNEIFSNYPTASDGGAASPNGQPIDDAGAVNASGQRIAFVAGGVPRLRVGTYPPTAPQGGWKLRVVRKIP